MNNIGIGFLLVFLDFNLKFNGSQIGLIPDFAGYILMRNGLSEMASESEQFRKVMPYATGMAVYTGVLYFGDLTGLTASLGMLSYLLAIASTVFSLYISYHIVMGITEMEETYHTPLNGDGLKSIWNLLAIFSVLTFVFLLNPVIAGIFTLVSFIIAIFFLVTFYQSKNLYDAIVR